MFDGICIEIEIFDFQTWRLLMPFEIHTPVNTDNGSIKSKTRRDKSVNGKILQSTYQTITHTAKFETYNITIREVIREGFTTRYYLKIEGSLHKNKFNGANYERFDGLGVKEEIEKLCTVLNISPLRARIKNLEFGVNIPVDFKPYPFLQEHLINYKNIPFNQYAPDNKNRRLGYECRLSQYRVKCYDKGLQFNLPYNLMRFELKYDKMQPLSRQGIKCLNDLTNPDILSNLKRLLLQAWNDVLLFEPTNTRNDVLTELQKELIKVGNNPKYWTGLHATNTRQLFYHREIYKDLLQTYGKGYHSEILAKIGQIWRELENPELYDLPIKIKGKSLQSPTGLANSYSKVELNRHERI